MSAPNSPQSAPEGTYITDIEDGLVNYHYTECSYDSPDHIKKYRGIIHDFLDNNRVVRRSLPFTPEIPTSDIETIKKLSSNESQAKYFPAIESSTIYVYFHPRLNTWRISTHKKINAFESFWGEKMDGNGSFGENFMVALTANKVLNDSNQGVDYESEFLSFAENLDKKLTHVFIVGNNWANKIVCTPTFPFMFHVGSIDNNSGLMVEGNFTGLPSLQQLEMSSIQEAIEYAENIDPRIIQGVMVYFPNQTMLKIMNTEYVRLFNLRNNCPSIMMRYIELRNDDSIYEFMSLYPEFNDKFVECENIFTESVYRIEKCYRKRYIQESYAVLPPIEYHIMLKYRQLHETKKFDRNLLMNVFNEYDSEYLYRLYKMYIN